MCPGLRQLTRMPPLPSSRTGLHSMARFLASWMTAASDEADTAVAFVLEHLAGHGRGSRKDA